MRPPGDPLADPRVQEELSRLGTTDAPPPVGFFDDFGSATALGIPRGFAEAGAALDMAGNAANRATNTLLEPLFSKEAIEFNQRINETDRQAIVRDLGRVEQELRPDPLTTGAAGQIGNELTAILPRTIVATGAGGPLAGAVAAGAPVGVGESAKLQAEGVDAETANTVGAIRGGVTGVGAMLPAGGVFRGAVADTSAALAANVGLGIAERKATREVLEANGYPVMAAQYDALDKTAITTDAALSLILSGAHRLTTAQVDATLTNRNADRMARGDGLLATTPRAANATDAAKVEALAAITTGRPVDVSGKVQDVELLRDPFFEPPVLPAEVHDAARAATTTAGGFDAVAAQIVRLESGGVADAKNPRSSATGVGQFIDSTWLNLIRRARPDLAAGKSDGELLALRTDATLSREMVAELARENAAALEQGGVSPTPQALYAAHHFGPDKAIALARAADDTPLSEVLTAAEIKANPYLRGMTKAELLANWERRGIAAEQAAVARVAESAPRPEVADLSPVRAADDAITAGRALAEGEDVRARPSVVSRVVDFVTGRRSEAQATPAASRSVELPNDPAIVEARVLAAEAPTQPVMVGQDLDGAPAYRSVAEVMDDIHAEYEGAAREASAFQAAASCFARRGGAVAA